MVPPWPRLSLRIFLNPVVQGTTSYRSELAGNIKPLHPSFLGRRQCSHTSSTEASLAGAVTCCPAASQLHWSCSPVGCCCSAMPWLGHLGSFQPALVPITDTEHHFLESLFLLDLGACWKQECCPRPGCDFAQTLAHPRRYHSLATLAFGLLASL